MTEILDAAVAAAGASAHSADAAFHAAESARKAAKGATCETRPEPVMSQHVSINDWGGAPGERLKIPTYENGHDGQVTHPAVVHVPEGWNGYEYWMANTPYPGSNDAYEDPSINASHDGTVWVEPKGISNPIDDQPGGKKGGIYNSDTDLVLVDDVMHLFWRTRDNWNPATGETVYHSESTDGVNWSSKEIVLQESKQKLTLLSPTLIHRDGVWTMYYVDMVPSPNKVMVTTATHLAGPWSPAKVAPVKPILAGKEPWHLQVREAYGLTWMLLNDTLIGKSGHEGELVLAVSDDGVNFRASDKPIIGRKSDANEHRWFYDTLYRSTLVPAIVDGVQGFDVWYAGRDFQRPSSEATWYLYRTTIRVGGRDTGWQAIPMAKGYGAGTNPDDTSSVSAWRVKGSTLTIKGVVHLAGGKTFTRGYKPITTKPAPDHWAMPESPHRGFVYGNWGMFSGTSLVESGEPLKMVVAGESGGTTYLAYESSYEL